MNIGKKTKTKQTTTTTTTTDNLSDACFHPRPGSDAARLPRLFVHTPYLCRNSELTLSGMSVNGKCVKLIEYIYPIWGTKKLKNEVLLICQKMLIEREGGGLNYSSM